MSLHEVTPAAQPQRSSPAAWWLMSLALGVGLAVAFFVVRNRLADPTPPLTAESFAAAWERWQTHGPQDYEIETRVTGTQGATYRVVVVAGEAREAFRNARPLQQKRTFETWSVPGMFGTIEADLTRLTQSKPGAAPARLTLRAEFDSQFGYPCKFRRIEWGQSTEVAWEVIKFVPASSKK